MSELRDSLRFELFWILGNIEGGLDAREIILQHADGLLAQFVQQDIAYLERLKNKLENVIKLTGVDVEYESQTSSSSC